MVINISKLSKREKNLVGILILIISCLPFFLFTVPAWNEFKQTKQIAEESASKIKSLKAQTESLSRLQKENKILEKKVNARKTFLAKSHEIDFLVQDLRAICDESSVSLESFTPTEIEPVNIVLEKQVEAELTGKIANTAALKENKSKLKKQSLQVDLYKYPIEVKITGNFTDIVELFNKLEQYGRVISIENISMGKLQTRKTSGSRLTRSSKPDRDNASDSGALYSSFNLVAYSLASENETLPFTSLERSAKKTFKYTYQKKK